MKCNIAVVGGDGIGPDIVAEAVKVLKTIGEKFGHRFEYEYAMAGGCAIDKYGVALPDDTLEICKKNDAVLLLSLIHIWLAELIEKKYSC